MFGSPLSVLFISCLLHRTRAKEIRIALRENVTLPCEHAGADLIDEKSLKFTLNEVPTQTRSLTSDQLIVMGRDGKRMSLRFPGCYRVSLSFRLKRALSNPYVETFLRMGTNLPCQVEEERRDVSVEQNAQRLCTNITRPVDWCPKSQNAKLRRMTRDKNTCHFCNLCAKAKEAARENEQKFLATDSQTQDQECHTDRLQQTLHFKICTPDRKEMHKMNEDGDGKFDEYWQYLKQGVLSVVMHVADRTTPTKSKMRGCERMCATLKGGSSRSASYRATLTKTLNSVCHPTDDYVTCLYHTMKFDVLDSLT